MGSIDLWGLQRLKVTNINNRRSRGSYRTSPISSSHRNTITAGTSLLHPSAATRVGAVERGGTNISSVSGRVARHAAEDGNMTEGIGSQRNAFRHALWSASITSEFGANTAEDITNAHEGIGAGQKGEVDFSQPLVQNAQLADAMVDFLNNEIGREIGEQGGSINDIANAVINTFQTEGLWTVTTDDNGNLKIERTQITEEQADQAREQLNTLDENGFNQEDRDDLERN